MYYALRTIKKSHQLVPGTVKPRHAEEKLHETVKFRCCAAAYKSLARHLEACTQHGIARQDDHHPGSPGVECSRMQSNAACKMGRLAFSSTVLRAPGLPRARAHATDSLRCRGPSPLDFFFGLICRIPESPLPASTPPASASCFHFLLPLSSFQDLSICSDIQDSSRFLSKHFFNIVLCLVLEHQKKIDSNTHGTDHPWGCI